MNGINHRNVLYVAKRLHQANKLTYAKTLYERILKSDKDNCEALHLLGVIYAQLKNYQIAATLIEKSLDLSPNNAVAQNNYGNILKALNRPAEALNHYSIATKIDPTYADAYFNLGNTQSQLSRNHDAIKNYNVAIQLNLKRKDVYFNCGNAYKKLNMLNEAVACYEAAVNICADYVEAYNNLANTLYEIGEHDKALEQYDRAITIKAHHPETHNNRGNCLLKLQRPLEALESFQQAIRMNPNYAEAYNNLGTALNRLNRIDDALKCYDKALKLNPYYTEAHSNRGNLMVTLGQIDDAIASYNQAIEGDPAYAEAYWHKSLALLLKGEFSVGWELYEWRWKSKNTKLRQRVLTGTLWQGSPEIRDKTIYIYAEQGFGDIIQFCRYTKKIKQLGARVILEVPAPLKNLMESLEGADELVEEGSKIPQFDYYCPILTLPLIFKTQLHTIPSAARYLYAPQSRNIYWRNLLGNKTNLRVGISWRGRATHNNDHNRSCPLQELIDYLPEAHNYISLQKEISDADRGVLLARKIRNFESTIIDFGDTAAICDNVDLVITVDTSVAHVAASIGKPTWILLPYIPDWRWMLNREDSPWYPSVRLFRQDESRTWRSALKKINEELINIKYNS